MTTLSIILSDTLAKASQEAAGRLGISRTQFIRQAILHELEQFEAKLEQDAMIRSILSMKENKAYLQETKQITEILNSTLPDDGEEWWNPKES